MKFPGLSELLYLISWSVSLLGYFFRMAYLPTLLKRFVSTEAFRYLLETYLWSVPFFLVDKGI